MEHLSNDEFMTIVDVFKDLKKWRDDDEAQNSGHLVSGLH